MRAGLDDRVVVRSARGAATTGREVRHTPGLFELVTLGLSAAFSCDRECLVRPASLLILQVQGWGTRGTRAFYTLGIG